MEADKYREWEQTRQQGVIGFVLRYVIYVGVSSTVVIALLVVGYPALKAGSWTSFQQGLLDYNWLSRLAKGLFFGFAVGFINWYQNEKAFAKGPVHE